METRATKIRAKKHSMVTISVIPGHFATNHSHVNYYVDITGIKHHCKAAQLTAEELAGHYANSTPVDTIICMDGCEMIGGFMARELSHSNTLSLSSDTDICVLTPEYNSNGQMVFRDNLQSMIWGKNVLLLIASATTGKTINRSLDCIAYYGGKTVGIAAIFSAIPEMLGQQIYSIFSADDLPDYQTFVPHDCPFCKEQRKIDAIVSSSGYTKIK